MRQNLAGKTLSEIQDIVRNNEIEERFANEIAYWLYKRKCSSFHEMDTIPKAVRHWLDERYVIQYFPFIKEEISSDGSRKYLFPVSSGGYVEAALIPDKNRLTLCISTQQGCRWSCAFCLTGRQGFQGNLATSDIINQVMEVWKQHELTHIVFMGMGEPLDNLPAVMPALEILTSQWGLSISPRNVTVSTIGLMPALEELLRKSRVNITLSLHSPFPEERKRFIPAEKRHPVKKSLAIIRRYPLEAKRRVSVAYVLLKGINDTSNHLDALVTLLRGTSCRVNLIPYHPVPGLHFQPADAPTLHHFFTELNRRGVPATIRRSRGYDINAACGMLSTLHLE
jgi:23S rRNA (adenine2503-C2)-methyltransferase